MASTLPWFSSYPLCPPQNPRPMKPTAPRHHQLSNPGKLNVTKSRTSLSSPKTTCASSTFFHWQIAAQSTVILSLILKLPPLDFTLPHPQKQQVTNLCWFHLFSTPYIAPTFSAILLLFNYGLSHHLSPVLLQWSPGQSVFLWSS